MNFTNSDLRSVEVSVECEKISNFNTCHMCNRSMKVQPTYFQHFKESILL